MNTKKTEVTKVIFRKWKDGSILALFPYEEWSQFECASYMHLGQHSGADYNYCIRITKPATEADYLPLYNELTAIGYNLQIIKKYKSKNR